MARRIVIDCDRCDRKWVTEATTITCNVGYAKTHAGAPVQFTTEHIDLCPRCAASLLQAAVAGLDTDEQKEWLAAARKR